MTKEEFREIIVNSKCSYKFLGAEEGCWLGTDEEGRDKEYWIPKMSKEYKENCIRYLKKHKENIEMGFFLDGVYYKDKDYKELVRLGCEAMKEKIQELSS